MTRDGGPTELQAQGIAAAAAVFDRLAGEIARSGIDAEDPGARAGVGAGAAAEAGMGAEQGIGAGAAAGVDAGTAAAAGAADAGESGGADRVGEQQLRAAGARLVDLFAGLFQEGIQAYLELAQTILRSPVPGAPAAAPAPGVSLWGAPGVSLSGAPGGRATTTVWLHNMTGEPAGRAELRMSDLEAASGERLATAGSQFVPRTVELGAGESGSSILTLAIPPGTSADTYFGHVLVSGAGVGGLPIAVVVGDRAG